jgi:triacylglycerol lipase
MIPRTLPDSSPPRSWGRRAARAIFGTGSLSLAILLLLHFAPARPRAQVPSVDPCARRPLILIHGHYYTNASLTVLRDRFLADGWPGSRVVMLNVRTRDCTHKWAVALSRKVDALVRATGCPTVDVVAHSRGGLAAREYIRFLGGAPRVAHLVTLGTPHHGAWMSRGCPGCGCREMRPGSAYLKRLNAGARTPGPTEYTSIVSLSDDVVSPHSAWLQGARNVEVRGVTHTDLLRSRSVYEEIRAGLL